MREQECKAIRRCIGVVFFLVVIYSAIAIHAPSINAAQDGQQVWISVDGFLDAVAAI